MGTFVLALLIEMAPNHFSCYQQIEVTHRGVQDTYLLRVDKCLIAGHLCRKAYGLVC